MLLVGDFPLQPNLSLSHASTRTQQPCLGIRTTGFTTAIILILNNSNDNRDAFVGRVEVVKWTSSFICVIGPGPRHLQRAQQWCLVSQPHPTPHYTHNDLGHMSIPETTTDRPQDAPQKDFVGISLCLCEHVPK